MLCHAQADKLRIGGIPAHDSPPFVWLNHCHSPQVFDGYLPDTISKLFGKLGHEFEFLPPVTMRQLSNKDRIDRMLQGEWDVMLTTRWFDNPDLVFSTEPILVNERIVVYRERDGFKPKGLKDFIAMKGLIPGLLRRADVLQKLLDDGLDAQFFMDTKSAFDALFNGEVDFILVSRYTAKVNLSERNANDVAILPAPELNDKFFLVARKDKVSEQQMSAIDYELKKYQHPERQNLLFISFLRRWVDKTCD